MNRNGVSLGKRHESSEFDLKAKLGVRIGIFGGLGLQRTWIWEVDEGGLMWSNFDVIGLWDCVDKENIDHFFFIESHFFENLRSKSEHLQKECQTYPEWKNTCVLRGCELQNSNIGGGLSPHRIDSEQQRMWHGSLTHFGEHTGWQKNLVSFLELWLAHESTWVSSEEILVLDWSSLVGGWLASSSSWSTIGVATVSV